MDFSAIVNSQATVTTAKAFNESADGIIKFVENLFSGCLRIGIPSVSYFDNSLKLHTCEARGCGQFFPFTEVANVPNGFKGTF